MKLFYYIILPRGVNNNNNNNNNNNTFSYFNIKHCKINLNYCFNVRCQNEKKMELKIVIAPRCFKLGVTKTQNGKRNGKWNVMENNES